MCCFLVDFLIVVHEGSRIICWHGPLEHQNFNYMQYDVYGRWLPSPQRFIPRPHQKGLIGHISYM